MKAIVYFALVILVLSLTAVNAAAEKFALVIAVGDYPEESRWPDISSVNDVPHVQASLLSLGFAESHIFYLKDEQATRAGILQAFSDLSAQLSEGDMVYIHYSGHGQQVLDDNDDEIDELDEAIVPHDSPMAFEAGIYEGENLIRDDELGRLTNDIRRICGPDGQVVLILDSCHSGTGTRGMGKVRGTDKVMAPDDFKVNYAAVESTAGIVDRDMAGLAPMASYYGASPRELNYEAIDEQRRPVGSLSYAMSQVLTEAQEPLSFIDVYDRVRLKMKSLAPRQNPQWEGPSDVNLFDGSQVASSSNNKVIDIYTDNLISIDAGTLTDVYTGTKVQLIAENGDVVSSGSVTVANLITSEVELITAIERGEFYHVDIVEKIEPPIRVTLGTNISEDSPWAELLRQVVSLSTTEIVAANADLHLRECEDQSLQLATRVGEVLETIRSPINVQKAMIESMLTRVRAYSQGQFLREFEQVNRRHDFQLQLILVDCRSGAVVKEVSEQDSELPIGTCVQFKITNKGIKGAYFSLIDIQSDNIVNIIAPATELGYTADEYYLEPGSEYVTDYLIEIAQPAGQEALKLLSSDKPLDLSRVIRTKGQSTRGLTDSNPLEQLFADTYGSVKTRGISVKKSHATAIGAQTLYFHIVE